MKAGIRKILILICIFMLGYGSYHFTMGKIRSEYRGLWEYRRLSPDFLPNADGIKLFSAGHTPSYGDTLWIGLMQYVAENIGNNGYHTFVNPILSSIQEVHPYFPSIYIFGLLLAPSLQQEEGLMQNKSINESAYNLGKKGMSITCDEEKINQISKQALDIKLWENIDLQNPCTDGMLPFYMGYTASELGYYSEAEEYYKIASMNSDAPLASRFLGPLMDTKEGDYIKGAEKFILIGLGSYDKDPFACQTALTDLLGRIKTGAISETVGILREVEDQVRISSDMSDPRIDGDLSCLRFMERAMKQLYLAHIDEVSREYPEIKSGKELIEKGIIESYGTIKEQDGFDLIKSDKDIWSFRKPL